MEQDMLDQKGLSRRSSHALLCSAATALEYQLRRDRGLLDGKVGAATGGQGAKEEAPVSQKPLPQGTLKCGHPRIDRGVTRPGLLNAHFVGCPLFMLV